MTTAWIAGASGLVGTYLLDRLLADDGFDRVVSVGRRAVAREHTKLQQVVVELGSAQAFAGLPAPTVAFCTLGTTMKKAGSKEAFRAIDHDAVLAFARAALDGGAKAFVHVTSIGADPASRAFYTRVKGEVEQALARQGWESLYALRPSFIDGERGERRPFERVGLSLVRVVAPVLGRYAPNKAADIARVMVEKAKERAPGVHVVDAAVMH
ncbi:MAG: nucleoside-diphosphate sugar epimerase [Labilithrix sp.]|nr:nucleoside-diphosphate sugar epimerase [Labilithrix sp.]